MTWIWRSRWVGFGRGTENGRRPWRHDNRSFRGVFGHTIVNSVLVVGAVGNDGSERLVDLVEQGAEFGSIVDFLAGQGRGDDRAGPGIDTQVQLTLPRQTGPGATSVMRRLS